jgi:putative transposase
MATASRIEAHFLTATILEWKPLLKLPKYKDIVVDSLRFLVAENKVAIYGFVIMHNHIHIIWDVKEGHKYALVQQSLLRYTAGRLKSDLETNHPEVLERFRVDACDRIYQFWERNPLTVDLCTEAVLLQKLNYVHQNPVRAGLCSEAGDYYYTSASFYDSGVDAFGFLSRYDRYS